MKDSSRHEGRIFIVLATLANLSKGDERVEYHLDSESGWSPLRIVHTKNGEKVEEVRNTLDRYGDVWFPRIIRRYLKSFRNGETPYETTTIDAASFAGNLPDSFKPADIGVEVGTTVIYEAPHGGKSKALIWDGTKGVPIEDYIKRQKSGELKRGPTILRSMQEAYERGSRPSAQPAARGEALAA